MRLHLVVTRLLVRRRGHVGRCDSVPSRVVAHARGEQMSELIRRQRQSLSDLLEGLTPVQWDAETLCAGWDAGDIAAHLVVREREPLAGPGILLPGPFQAFTRRRQLAWKARGRDAVLRALRAGPPWPLSGPLGNGQVVEDWIHEQDVRRGGAQAGPGESAPQLGPLLWVAAKRFASRTLAVGDLVVELTDGERRHRLTAQRWLPIARETDAPASVTITGPAGELLLYAAGRRGAGVTITGDPSARHTLAAVKRSV